MEEGKRKITVYDIMERKGSEQKKQDFMRKTAWPYSMKKKYAEKVAYDFYMHPEIAGRCFVSVGGLDSITLFIFLKSIGIDVPGVSVSSLEDKSIQKVHRALGVKSLPLACDKDGRPYTKMRVISEFGWPVISKETAQKISHLQHPTEKNATVRHAIMTGETGAYGGYQKNSRMKLAQKWLELFGGSENEKEGTNYKIAPFLVTSDCCYWMKEKPCDDYAKENKAYPYMGLMASEGGRRQKALMMNGCNYISKGTKRSCPFAIFNRQDLLRLALEMDDFYRENKQKFPGEPIESIIPDIYGGIEKKELSEEERKKAREKAEEASGGDDQMLSVWLDDLTFARLRTTKAQRTGCQMCGFGVHLEKRPHRFDRLFEKDPKEWDFWMNRVVQDSDGNWSGWGKVLDYIGVEWREPERFLEGKEEEKV